MRKYNWKKIFHIILLFLLASIFIGSIYLKIEYADESIEELDRENQKIYSREQEQKYGALAIRIALI